MRGKRSHATVVTKIGSRFFASLQAKVINNFCAIVSKFTLDKRAFKCYIIPMRTIMISPTNKASQRTKNRIREKGPVFNVEPETFAGSHLLEAGPTWLLRAAPPHKFGAEIWMGWLPRNEFHVECVGKKFIEKVLG